MSEKEKHAGGRPPKFETPEELDNQIDAYFLSLEYGEDEYGNTLRKSPTITGLALFLGFCDRQSLYDYQNRPEFSCIIKKARCMVEQGYEEALLTKGSTGAIFALKNMGWNDKVEQEITEHKITIVEPEFD